MSEQMPTPPSIVPTAPQPVPEVFDDEGRRVIRPDVISLITQLNIAAQSVKQTNLLQSLYDHEKDLEGDGLIRRMTLAVSDERLNLLLPELWQSVTIVNDGSNTVYLKINSPYADTIPLNEGESFDHDTKTHKIRRLFLYCDSGLTSSVRLVGNY